MAASAGTRLISADDHVDVTQEQVKAFLHPKHHDALRRGRREGRGGVAATLEHRDEPGVARAAEPPAARRSRASAATTVTRRVGRPGHHDPVARLRRHGHRRGRRVRRAIARSARSATSTSSRTARRRRPARSTPRSAEFASADPKRLVVAYQIPIHDVDMADRRGAVGGRQRVQVAAASRSSRPSSASPTTGTPATTRSGPRSRMPTCRCACTSASSSGSRTSSSATPRRNAASSSRWSSSRRPRRSGCGC